MQETGQSDLGDVKKRDGFHVKAETIVSAQLEFWREHEVASVHVIVLSIPGFVSRSGVKKLFSVCLQLSLF